MKKIKMLLLLAVAVIVASCGKQQGPSPMSMIPEDAAMVMSVNMKSLIDKSGIEVKDGQVIFPDSYSSLLQNLSASDKGELDGLAESGVDFEGRAYLFVNSSDFQVGLIVPIKDKEAFKGYVEKVDESTMTADGEEYYKCVDGRMVQLISDYYFGVFEMKGTSDEATCKAVMSGTLEKPISTKKSAVKALDGGNDIMAWINYEGLMSMASGSSMSAAAILQGGMLASVINSVDGVSGTLDFNKKSIDLVAKTIYKEGTDVIANFEQIYGKASAEGLKFIPNDVEAVMSLTMNGENILKINEISNLLLQYKDNAMLSRDELRDYIAGIDGPITIGMNYSSLIYNKYSVPAIYGAIKNKNCEKIFAKVESLLRGMGFPVMKNGDEIVVNFRDASSVAVGCKDGFLYFRTSGAPVSKSMYDDSQAREIMESASCGLYVPVKDGSSVQRILTTLDPALKISGYASACSSTEESTMSIVVDSPENDNIIITLLSVIAQSQLAK